MADSDNTTTLPLVTRRRVARGKTIAMVEWPPKPFPSDDLGKNRSVDPAVAVWHSWQDAHNLTARLCRDQQRLERKLIESVGFPCAMIQRPDGESITLHSLEDLRRVLSVCPVDATVRAKAEAEFAAHQRRWDVADTEIGYSATLRAELEASDKEEELLLALSETPATSLAGVAAKLDAALREGQTSKDDPEFPWPQIRSAFEDIAGVGDRA